MKKGEVWRLRFPFAPCRTQAGERPAVIVHNEPSLSSLPVVLVVPFTSQLSAARFAGTLTVQPDGCNGLSMPSVALVFQLGAQVKRNLRHRLGELDPATMDAILELIRQLTVANQRDNPPELSRLAGAAPSTPESGHTSSTYVAVLALQRSDVEG